MFNRSQLGEKGFLLIDGSFQRFEPIGVTWDDTYCRKITNAEQSGCFVKRSIYAVPEFNLENNNCSG